MTESSEVKGQIKLRFNNRSGFPCVVVRSVQVTRKKTKMEFKALDSLLRTTNSAGEKISTSMKCSELDKQIPEHLGVSAAVVENVIFCHQEDSYWPMRDGATVKKIFDDIFDSTRYSKALDAIVKAKKEKASSAKDLKGEALELGAHLQSAKQSRKELRQCKENQRTCDESLQEAVEKIAQLDYRVNIN